MHRLAFPPNATVPLAVRVNEPGGGSLSSLDPGAFTPFAPRARPQRPVNAKIELLALDADPLDGIEPAGDALWLRAAFTDPLGRSVEVRARAVAPGCGEEQRYGGVAVNLLRPSAGEDDPEASWVHLPLAAWARCEVRVNHALTDKDLLGILTLRQSFSPLPPRRTGAALDLHLCPRRVLEDGRTLSTPFQAAEEIGMAGWSLTWSDVTFYQAPVLSVRVERGDTFAKIARELAVDAEALRQANGWDEGEQLQPGELIRVPMLLRAADPPPKKVHPSVALTWTEIIRGWTTLN